jgi:hypothetical protein
VIAQLLFIIFLVAGLAAAAWGIFGGLVYDIKLSKVNKEALAHPYSRALRKRPLVALVVLVNDDNVGYLEQCLFSIARSSYRKYEIILASSLPATRTNLAVRDFKKRYPSKKIKTVKVDGSNWAIAAKKAKAEYIASINAACEVDRSSLSNAVQFLALRPKANAIIPHISKSSDYTIRGLLNQYKQILQNQWLKPSTLLNNCKPENSNFLIYRKGAVGDGVLRIQYCANVNIYTHYIKRRPNVRQSTRLFALQTLVLLVIFIAVSYSIYLSIVQHYTALLALVWTGFSLYLAINICTDEYLELNKKLSMSLMTPMVCLLFFLSLPKLLFDSASAQPARQHPSVQFVG